ncbi:hypothetical protein [Fibrobacter sp.]|uniref:hypothetical protein n=1 Tax=Fibrobacter sp. TaxID=35828 RepID=UPI00388D173B
MKAKDYFEKYEERIMKKDADSIKALEDMVEEFCIETEKLIEDRHIKLVGGMVGVMKEQNQKWNALCNLFVKKHGTSVLKRDVLKNSWIENMPDLGLVWR